ncbi:hypothetical protein PHET_09633, partial [Paragonimus heterotremus]
WIWHSDLDIFFGSYSVDSKLQNNELLSTIDNTASNKASNPTNDELINPSTWDNLRAVSPEFFNLALALMLLSFRYPSVFWYTNRAFSFIFSVLLFLTGIHALIDYCAASVLVKLALNSDSFPGWAHLRLVCISAQHTQNKGSDSSVQPYADSKLTTKAKANLNVLSCIAPLVLSTTGTLLFLFLFLTVFEYGYRQFSENLSTYRHYLMGSPSHANGFPVSNGDGDPYGQIADSNDTRANGHHPNGPTVVYTQSDSIHSGPNGSGKLLNPCHGVSSPRKRKYTLGAELLHPACRCCLHIYAPHIVGLIGSLCVLTFKLPLIWDYLQVYRLTRHALMLAAPLSGIVTLCAWFIVWFAFSLKPAWKFLVNLPLQTMPNPAVLPPPTMLMQSHPNGMIGGPMMGSLLRPSSLGIHGDGNNRLGTVMLSSQAGTLHPHLAPLLSTPLSTNCYGPDEGSITQVGVQPSPIYACFHDPTGMGYAGTSANAVPRFIRLGNSREVGVTAANVNGLPATLIVSGARNAEYDGEDAEVSSGRQSGSNYVCLQSALGSTGTGQAPIHGGVFASSATGGLVTRLIQPTTSESISPSPSQLRALESHAPTSFATQLPLINGQCRPTLDGGTVLSSPSEEDEGSTHTVQYLTNKLRSSGMQLSSVCPNSSTGTYSMLNIGKSSCTPRSPFSGDTQSTDMNQTANTYSREGSVRLSSTSMSFATANNGRQNLTNFRPTLNPTNTPGSGALTPRVTFREKVDMISHVSPTATAVGSPNHSSNDSGIDNLKIDNRSQTSILPFSPPSDGSGTYDNTFPASFCSGLVIRNPSQSNGEVDVTEESGTLQRSVGNVANTTNHLMNGSVYNDRHSKFTNQLNSNSASLSPTKPSNESTGLCTSVSINPSVHSSRTNEMIGDANNSFQSSNAEPFPLLFSSGLITEQTQEPRLCSQV